MIIMHSVPLFTQEIEYLVMNSNGKIFRRKLQYKTLDSSKRQKVSSGSTDSWSDVTFTVPRVMESRLDGSSIINITYFIQVGSFDLLIRCNSNGCRGCCFGGGSSSSSSSSGSSNNSSGSSSSSSCTKPLSKAKPSCLFSAFSETSFYSHFLYSVFYIPFLHSGESGIYQMLLR